MQTGVESPGSIRFMVYLEDSLQPTDPGRSTVCGLGLFPPSCQISEPLAVRDGKTDSLEGAI